MSRTNTAINSALNQRVKFATTMMIDGNGKPIYSMRSATEEAIETWLETKKADIAKGIERYSSAPRSKRINGFHKAASTAKHTKTQ